MKIAPSNLIRKQRMEELYSKYPPGQYPSPLPALVYSNEHTMLSHFLNEGYDPNTKGVNGSTALHAAVRHCPKVTGQLIKNGGSLRVKNKIGYTPIQIGVMELRFKNLEDVVVYALENNNELSENALNYLKKRAPACLKKVINRTSNTAKIMRALL